MELLCQAMSEMHGIMARTKPCGSDGLVVRVQHETPVTSISDGMWLRDARPCLGQVAYLMREHFKPATIVDMLVYTHDELPWTYSIQAAPVAAAARMRRVSCRTACCIVLARVLPMCRDMREMLARTLWSTRTNRKWRWQTAKATIMDVGCYAISAKGQQEK